MTTKASGKPHPWKFGLGSQSLIAQAAWAGLRIMVGYHALAQGADALFLALVTAIFAVPALLTAIPAGRAADRWGGSVVALLGSCLVSLGLVVVCFLPGLLWLTVASAIMGLGNLFQMVGQQTFVAHISLDKSTDGSFGFLSATASAGQAVGPMTVTFVAAGFTLSGGTTAGPIDPDSVGALPDTYMGLAACLVLAIVCIPLYWPMRRAERVWTPTKRTKHAAQRQRIDLKTVWPALLVSGIVLVTLDMLYTFVPLWATEKQIGATTVGILLSLRAAVSMMSRLGLRQLVLRFGRRKLLTVSIAGSVIGLAAMPLIGAGGAIIAMIFIGLGLGIPQPLTMAWAVAATPRELHGAVLGWRLSSNRLAQIILPVTLGSLAVPFGVAAIFYSNAALMGVAALLSYRRTHE